MRTQLYSRGIPSLVSQRFRQIIQTFCIDPKVQVSQSTARTNMHDVTPVVAPPDHGHFHIVHVPILQRFELYVHVSRFWIKSHNVKATTIDIGLTGWICFYDIIQLLECVFLRREYIGRPFPGWNVMVRIVDERIGGAKAVRRCIEGTNPERRRQPTLLGKSSES